MPGAGKTRRQEALFLSAAFPDLKEEHDGQLGTEDPQHCRDRRACPRRDNVEDPRCQVGHHAPPSDRGTLRIGKALPVVWSYRLGSLLRPISNLPKFLPFSRPVKASGALSSPSPMSSGYLIVPLFANGAT